ncbi:hypothetical protein [Nocardia lasii]|uniref:Uncharacterized protein n=1 Tax=Nocardia lasii TaxID=1616107 RepID=A0ABW1JM45_9NOCA
MKWREGDIHETGLSQLEWVSEGMRRRFPAQVDSLLPGIFPAYARLLHPLECADSAGREVWLRWSDAADALGATVHRQMQLGAILSNESNVDLRNHPPTQRHPTISWDDQLPELVSILRRHTTTPDSCYFAFWEGNTAFDGIPPEVPKLTIQDMRYFIFKGPISRAIDHFHGLPPTIWWTQDRKWLVSSPDDFPSTYVGGEVGCISEILESREIEAYIALGTDPVSVDSDTLNWRY